jgi:hypothetical protein
MKSSNTKKTYSLKKAAGTGLAMVTAGIMLTNAGCRSITKPDENDQRTITVLGNSRHMDGLNIPLDIKPSDLNSPQIGITHSDEDDKPVETKKEMSNSGLEFSIQKEILTDGYNPGIGFDSADTDANLIRTIDRLNLINGDLDGRFFSGLKEYVEAVIYSKTGRVPGESLVMDKEQRQVLKNHYVRNTLITNADERAYAESVLIDTAVTLDRVLDFHGSKFNISDKIDEIKDIDKREQAYDVVDKLEQKLNALHGPLVLMSSAKLLEGDFQSLRLPIMFNDNIESFNTGLSYSEIGKIVISNDDELFDSYVELIEDVEDAFHSKAPGHLDKIVYGARLKFMEKVLERVDDRRIDLKQMIGIAHAVDLEISSYQALGGQGAGDYDFWNSLVNVMPGVGTVDFISYMVDEGTVPDSFGDANLNDENRRIVNDTYNLMARAMVDVYFGARSGEHVVGDRRLLESEAYSGILRDVIYLIIHHHLWCDDGSGGSSVGSEPGIDGGEVPTIPPGMDGGGVNPIGGGPIGSVLPKNRFDLYLVPVDSINYDNIPKFELPDLRAV